MLEAGNPKIRETPIARFSSEIGATVKPLFRRHSRPVTHHGLRFSDNSVGASSLIALLGHPADPAGWTRCIDLYPVKARRCTRHLRDLFECYLLRLLSLSLPAQFPFELQETAKEEIAIISLSVFFKRRV